MKISHLYSASPFFIPYPSSSELPALFSTGCIRRHLLRKETVDWSPHGPFLDFRNAVYYGGYFSYIAHGESEPNPLYAGSRPVDLAPRSRRNRLLRALAPHLFRSLRLDRSRQRFETILSSRFPLAKLNRILGVDFYAGQVLKRLGRVLDRPLIIENLQTSLSPHLDARIHTSGTDLFRSLGTRTLPELIRLALDTLRYILWVQSNFSSGHRYYDSVPPFFSVLNAINAHIHRWIMEYTEDPKELQYFLVDLNRELFGGWFGTWVRISLGYFRSISRHVLDILRGPAYSGWELRYWSSAHNHRFDISHWPSISLDLSFWGRHRVKMDWRFPYDSFYEISVNSFGSYDIHLIEYVNERSLDEFKLAMSGGGILPKSTSLDTPFPLDHPMFGSMGSHSKRRGRPRKRAKTWFRDYVHPWLKTVVTRSGRRVPYRARRRKIPK